MKTLGILQAIDIDKKFFRKMAEVQAIKKMGLYQIKKLCTTKIQESDKTQWKKIFANYASNKN